MRVLRVAILGQGRSGRDIHGAHLSKDTERYRIVADDDVRAALERAEAANKTAPVSNVIALRQEAGGQSGDKRGR